VRSSPGLAEFRVLGPVEVVVEGRLVPLAAAKPRALLALLLLSRNRVVPTADLIDDLWGERPPETAAKALQGYVSQLRKALGAERLLTKPPGYCLSVADGELDLDRFEELVREGRERLAGGDAAAAATVLGQALELWRGRALAEFSEPFARDAGTSLEDARLGALEDRIDAELALGHHARVIPELEQLVAAEPYRERPRAQLMLALYRSGRQAEALDVYRRTRETLIDELGIEPGAELQELERAILRQDRTLKLGRRPWPARPEEEPPARRRRSRALAFALVAVAIAAAALALVLSRGGSSGASRDGGELRAFVVKLENFLGQSRNGRREIARTVNGAFDCSLTPQAAVRRLNRVQRNRQSLLQQVAALSVPDDRDAVRSSDLFQRSVGASIEADWHYRDWLETLRRCGAPSPSAELRAARVADAQATRTKRAFLSAFDPLARRFDQRVWRASEF
jgi:DNA-binding SARP family transcriptional activator